jgi:hypothetical protein
MNGRQIEFEKRSGYLKFEGFEPLDPDVAPLNNQKSARAGHMLCYRLSIESISGKESLIWIPVMEVIRAYFGVSSELLTQLFSGERYPSLARDSASTLQKLSKWIDEPKSYRLHCTKDIEDNEAVVMAYAFADEKMKRVHDSVHEKLQPAFGSRSKAFPEMIFPFPPKTRLWDLQGRPVRMMTKASHPANDDQQATDAKSPSSKFLVTRIMHIDYKPPFEKLELRIHKRKADPKNPPSNSRQVPSAGSKTNKLVKDPPSTARPAIEETVPGAVHELAHQVEIIRLDLQPGGAPGASPMRGEEQYERLAATEDRIPGGNPAVSHLKLVRDRNTFVDGKAGAIARLDSQVLTIRAVEFLADRKDWKILAGGIDSNGLPLLQRAEYDKISFTFMMLIVNSGYGQFVVADAGTVSHDERSLGLIARINNGVISREFIEEVKRFTAQEKGHWKDRKRSLPRGRFTFVSRHPIDIMNNLDAYSERIEVRIKKLFS